MDITLSTARDRRTFKDQDSLHALLDWARKDWAPARGSYMANDGFPVLCSYLKVSIDGGPDVPIREAIAQAGIPTC